MSAAYPQYPRPGDSTAAPASAPPPSGMSSVQVAAFRQRALELSMPSGMDPRIPTADVIQRAAQYANFIITGSVLDGK
jgi:hypothetical protein